MLHLCDLRSLLASCYLSGSARPRFVMCVPFEWCAPRSAIALRSLCLEPFLNLPGQL